jgi:hypothetical protein
MYCLCGNNSQTDLKIFQKELDIFLVLRIQFWLCDVRVYLDYQSTFLKSSLPLMVKQRCYTIFTNPGTTCSGCHIQLIQASGEESLWFCTPSPLFLLLLLSLPHRAFKTSSLSGKCCVACLLVSSTDLSSHHYFSSVLLSTTFSDELTSNGEEQLEEMRASLSPSLPVSTSSTPAVEETRGLTLGLGFDALFFFSAVW